MSESAPFTILSCGCKIYVHTRQVVRFCPQCNQKREELATGGGGE